MEPKYNTTRYRFGTSSFSLNDWLGTFYPKRMKSTEFLEYYSAKFDTVEIDAAYYAIPSVKTVEQWSEKTPDDFTFTAKFPRTIVHCGEGAKPDASRILMPDYAYAERDQFLGDLPRRFRYSVEIRNKWWLTEKFANYAALIMSHLRLSIRAGCLCRMRLKIDSIL